MQRKGAVFWRKEASASGQCVLYVFCMSPVYPQIHENSPDQPMCSSVSEKRSKEILLRSSHPYFTGDASAFWSGYWFC